MKRKDSFAVIGLSSLPGGGKDFIADILVEDYGFYKVSPGDTVREQIRKYGREITREGQQQIQKELRKKYGRDYIMELCYRKILKSRKKKIVIPGIRLPTDIKFYKDRFGGNFINIFVRAPKKLRYERVVKRSREDVPESYAEFLRQDSEEKVVFSLDTTKSRSDAFITNDNTKAYVKSEIKKVLKRLDKV